MAEFTPWPKTSRYNRPIVVTEKIDGTNAAVGIALLPDGEVITRDPQALYIDDEAGNTYAITAQSRKRIITPQSDNAGFAAWVAKNCDDLVQDLGVGVHFGEWWGQGIQRRYGMDRKVFSLFNTAKWADADFITDSLDVVPVLYEGANSQYEIEEALEDLRENGSVASSVYGFWQQPAEGVCIFHTASRIVQKITLVDDEKPKGSTE